MKYTPYSIAWADVPYEDVNYSEVRPILILGISKKDKNKALCAKITSKPPRPNYNDLQISNSVQIGLPQISTIRLDNLIYIQDNAIYERIGRLSTHDIKDVKEAEGYAPDWMLQFTDEEKLLKENSAIIAQHQKKHILEDGRSGWHVVGHENQLIGYKTVEKETTPAYDEDKLVGYQCGVCGEEKKL